MRGPDERAGEHQFLTLEGTWNLTWRMAECGIHHSSPMRNSICAMQNGIYMHQWCFVLYSYYCREFFDEGLYNSVCFDVRYEKYSFVKVMEPFVKALHPAANLVNYRHYFLMFPIYKL